jgi:Ca-activated chloride channel family protein
VRVEEYINAFDYRYEQPDAGQDFLLSVEGGPSPYNPRNDLIQVGVQARTVDQEERKPASLTFVVDTSGSMQIESRLNTVKQALKLLVGQMRADDRISIVSFGTGARLVLPPTNGSDRQRIVAAIDSLTTEGSTSIDAGLGEGFRAAQQAFREGAINMVLLCTDGVANNGVSDAEGLLNKYRQFLARGIQLSVFGFGMGNYNDVILEKLGAGGNGSYAYVDSADEARRVFVQNLTGTLLSVAREAKIQVDFNAEVVSRYRLLGYENRDVADADFRNDKADGGEVGAGQSVTALYEVTRKPDARGQVANVTIRYQTPDRSRALEASRTLQSDAVRSNMRETSRRFQLVTSVAQFAEVLKKSFWARGITLQDVARGTSDRFPEDNAEDVRELRELIQKAAAISEAKR